MKSALEQRLSDLKHLPRPIYGQTEALPNKVLGYRHSHPWVQFSYAISGVLEVQTAHGRFIAPPQRAVWIPAGIKHRVHSSVHTPIGRTLTCLRKNFKPFICAANRTDISPVATAFTLA